MSRRRAAVALVALWAVISGCGGGGGGDADEAQPIELEGLEVPARVHGDGIQLATPSGFEDRFWPGVNLGTTIPGRQPGEVAVRGGAYRRWLEQMGELGVEVIRVYTLLDPSFYDELDRYNAEHPAAPLYVLHGISIPEARYLKTGDLFDPVVLSEQRRITREVVSAVRGDLEVKDRLGEAHGRWTTDVRRWVIGWSFGVELDPPSLARSEKKNPDRAYEGRYISTTGRVSSTEAWLAQQLDRLATLEARDGWSRPVTFTNWITLDPLDHPYEPLEQEDLISLDAAHLRATGAWPGGFFASYHAYPYYPDFIRFTPEYAESGDPYAAYLAELRAHHRGQAVMITEFGVPSSLGAAHRGALGRDQGDHDEAEALSVDADLLRLIRDQGFAGGIVFEWTDEWFKRTWNTVEQELPESRRQLWRNPLTNEEYFGVLATEAGLADRVTVDGDPAEWESTPSQVLWESAGGLRELRAAHDEAYLYLVLRVDDRGLLDRGLTLGLDVRPGDNRGLPGIPGKAMPGAETSIRVDPDEIQVRNAAWTDPLAFQYGIDLPYLTDVRPADLKRGSGAWRKPKMILNRPLTIGPTGETRPVELLDLGDLPVRSELEDSRTVAAASGRAVELRIPWAMLGYSDPSSHTLIRPKANGRLGTESLPATRHVGIEVYDPNGTRLAKASPAYGWERWQSVRWSEREKRGAADLAAAFSGRSAPSPEKAVHAAAERTGLILILGTIGLCGLLIAMVVSRKRARDKRERRIAYRRDRVRAALLAADAEGIGEAAREALIIPAALTDFAVVLDRTYDELDDDAATALEDAVEKTSLPRRLVDELEADDSVTRGTAALLLSHLRLPEADEHLPELLTDPDPDVRLVACGGLGRLATGTAARALIQALRDGALAPERVIERLGRSWAVPALLDELASGDGTPGSDGGPADPGWRSAVLRALGVAADTRAEDALIAALLESGEKQERVDAARSLGTSGTGQCVEALVWALEDEAWEVRAQAARSLGAHPDQSAVEPLEKCLDHEAWWVRANAADALADLGPAGVEALRRALSSPDRYARDRAREALALHGEAVT